MHEGASELLAVAVRGARAGALVLQQYFRDQRLEACRKGEHDLVSEADHASESQILDEIRRAFPDHNIWSEEAGLTPGAAEFEWLVDPLDGTVNFLQGLPIFCVSIACRARGVVEIGVVLDPIGNNLFTASRGGGAWWNGQPMRVSSRAGLADAVLATGYPFRARKALDLYLQVFRAVFLRSRAIRRCGSAALDLAYTAAGIFDGFFEFRLSPWDFAAGCLLIHEAGGIVTDLDGGDRFFTSGNLIAGSPGLHAELLSILREHVSEAALDQVEPLLDHLASPIATP